MKESSLKTILTVLPVLSAGLYLLGTAYYQGYLATYGIDDSLFPISTERTLLVGFIAFVNVGFIPLGYTVLAFMCLVFAVLVAAVLSSTPMLHNLKAAFLAKVARFRHAKSIPESIENLTGKGESIYTYLAGIFICCFLMILGASASGKSGSKHAEKEMESFASGQGSFVTVVSSLLPTSAKAKKIVCSASHCAFWLGTETVILRHDSLDRIVAHRASEKEVATTKPGSTRQ